jgi:hypothetical protein
MFEAAAALSFAFAVIPVSKAPSARAAVERALPQLRAAADGHVAKRSCYACHNQAFPVMAFNAANGKGFAPAGPLFGTQVDHILTFLTENKEKFRSGQGTGGQVDTAGYALLTLELAGHKPDDVTEAVAEYLVKTQADRGYWKTVSNRPPTEASDFTATYLALRGLRAWGGPEQKERAAKRTKAAREWLLKTGPKDTEDRVFRLFGLKEVAADEKEVAAAAWELLKTQRADGGWGQLDRLPSDPYATGTALVALHEAGGLSPDHPAYARGVAFLIHTQQPDGSWWVKSRSIPFQPYYEGGFPHGKNQFISSAASGWATTALVYASK